MEPNFFEDLWGWRPPPDVGNKDAKALCQGLSLIIFGKLGWFRSMSKSMCQSSHSDDDT